MVGQDDGACDREGGRSLSGREEEGAELQEAVRNLGMGGGNVRWFGVDSVPTHFIKRLFVKNNMIPFLV